MKTIYSVCEIITTKVCVPSDSYYGRGGDWQEQDIITLRPVEEFDEEQLAIEYINQNYLSWFYKGQYTILKIYKL